MSDKDYKITKRSRGKGVASSSKPNNEKTPKEPAVVHEPRGKAVGSSGKPNKKDD